MMRQLAEQSYFLLCRALGRLLRAGRYSRIRVACGDDPSEVRKQRLFHAPLLVWIGGPLMKILDTGVRVLPQRQWEERERPVYQVLHGRAIRTDADGTLVLPRLRGQSLAALLDDRKLEESTRSKAIDLAVRSIADLDESGFTHGDAMAENVMVDVEAGIARWIDFETIHESSRPVAWRRADDVRALLATCLLRTAPVNLGETLHFIVAVYGDEEVTRMLGASFTSAFQRPLTFHLGQAGLSFRSFRAIGRLLQAS